MIYEINGIKWNWLKKSRKHEASNCRSPLHSLYFFPFPLFENERNEEIKKEWKAFAAQPVCRMNEMNEAWRGEQLALDGMSQSIINSQFLFNKRREMELIDLLMNGASAVNPQLFFQFDSWKEWIKWRKVSVDGAGLQGSLPLFFRGPTQKEKKEWSQ